MMMFNKQIYRGSQMQLTKQTDFAFRVLIYLAAMPESSQTQIQQIANRYGISKSHVMKIVQKLVHHGYVAAKRGHNGGLSLGKSANQISLKAIIQLMEQTLDPINCKESACLLTENCLLKSHLIAAQERYLTYLETIYLSDVISSKTKDILFISPIIDLLPTTDNPCQTMNNNAC